MKIKWLRKFYVAVLLLVGGCLTPVLDAAEPGQSTSHAGYIYPAGAQRGQSLEVSVGGQGLRKVKEVYISGEGVKATVIRTIPNFKRTQGNYIRFLLKEARMKEKAVGKNKKGGGKKRKSEAKRKKSKKLKKVPAKDEYQPPPDHPLFRGLDQLDSKALSKKLQLYYKENKQKNRQLDDRLLLKLEIAPKAILGMREIRFRTGNGLSNPVRFFIGARPEVLEHEPNRKIPNQTKRFAPFVLNGQIMPGDVDQFSFYAKEGQELVIQGHARKILPYLADAVPGWFQATLTLFDSDGNELAYVDDYRFDPDPVMLFNVPADGEYTVQITDSIFRGREDFVYRISVGEDAFISSIFPMGGRQGSRVMASLSGTHLPVKQVLLNTDLDPGTTQSIQWKQSNVMRYAIDDFPECVEREKNDTQATAQAVKVPVVINGRINAPGDRDVYRFKADRGESLVVEVNARRLLSPVDSKIKLTDSTGHVIAWNDDTKQLNAGMLTHHSDSRLEVKIPKSGTYFVTIEDTQKKGGNEYGYRLRISRPHPDFALIASPASITVKLGCSVPIMVHAIRKDGFDGEIKLVLKDAPKGFHLSGTTIPAGADELRMTLTAPRDARNSLFRIRLQARSKIEGRLVTRNVTPAQAMTQAFITPHVVAAQECMVFVGGWGEVIELELSKNTKVKIPRGGETTLRVKKRKFDKSLVLKLYQAPDGLSLVQKHDGKNAMTVYLKASKKAKVGTSGNLMIEVLREQKTKTGKIKYTSLGVMPALPFVVVP